MPTGPPWSDEDQKLLEELWERKWTAGAIGARIERSRNAVIGRVHRTRLTFPADQEHPHPLTMRKRKPANYNPRKPRPKAPPRPVGSRVSLAPMDVSPILSVTGGVGIIDIKAGCRAIIGRDAEGHRLVRFCGASTAQGKSFCPGHHAEYFQPPR